MPVKQKKLIDINHASETELMGIPGIGSSLAQGIVDHRPYLKLGDLTEVPGISEKKLETLLPYFQVSPPGKKAVAEKPSREKPITKLGHTEAFVFLEDRNERADAFLIIFAGFIIGLIILLLRRSD